MRTLHLSLGLLLLAAQAAIAPQLQGQDLPGPQPSSSEVVGISYILPGGGPTITAYAATEIGSEVAAYYDAYVEAYLNAGTQTVSYGSAGFQAVGLRQTIESVVELHSVEMLGVELQHLRGRKLFGIERPAPVLVVPTGSSDMDGSRLHTA